jgi:hypothetical protein
MSLVEMATRKHKSSRSRSHSRMHKKSQRRRQSGGAMLAPFAAGDAYLLDAQTRIQAEVGPLDKAFADLPSVIPRQAGGRRGRGRGRVSRKTRAHKHKGSRKACTRKHRSSSRSHSSRRSRSRSHSSRRSQRGGALASFAGSYTLMDHHAMTPKMLAQNDQFVSESTVNADYSQFAGAQKA